MKETERDDFACGLAEKFLFDIEVTGVTSELISEYLNPPFLAQRPSTLNGIYERILESAQNANMNAGVIGGSINGVKNFGGVLFEFDPKAVIAN